MTKKHLLIALSLIACIGTTSCNNSLSASLTKGGVVTYLENRGVMPDFLCEDEEDAPEGVYDVPLFHSYEIQDDELYYWNER